MLYENLNDIEVQFEVLIVMTGASCISLLELFSCLCQHHESVCSLQECFLDVHFLWMN